ncbi:hypothetical protein [Paenibacillus sp. IHB B 3415]|uniref:hypothetical protein n=1 Tax=Paenibacillus sp. IHB B 3415 TaxID=867080 RepID=UPI00128D5237|nr:hypothetical protein [Paenibacillus sp. IHB B 3415]
MEGGVFVVFEINPWKGSESGLAGSRTRRRGSDAGRRGGEVIARNPAENTTIPDSKLPIRRNLAENTTIRGFKLPSRQKSCKKYNNTGSDPPNLSEILQKVQQYRI